MNGMNTKRWGRGTLVVARTLMLIAAGTFGCSNSSTPTTVASTGYACDDYYLYTAYYPVDVAYSGYYWADSWNYSTFYIGATYGGGTGAAGTTGSAGTTGTSVATGGTTGQAGTTGTSGTSVRTGSTVLATTIEALARGESVCPGQVTVTEKFATPACAGGTATQERNGVTIQFNGCLASGQTISGTFDVQSNRSAADQTCTASTVITLGHTTTITNLTISGPNGKITIPSQTTTAMTTYTFGQSPTTLSTNTTGELQIFNSAGTMVSDLSHTGTDTFTFAGSTSYSVDGNSTVQDKNGTATATITKTGLTRSTSCCRPTGGSVTINATNVTGGCTSGQTNWTFGPSCGAVTRNNVSVMLPACI